MAKFTVDFIGIGTEKAATYWIADILRDHPEVCFSSRKEIAFFNEYDQHFLKVKNNRYEWGMEWYKKHFKHCSGDLLKGEFTPTYMYSKKAAERIKKHFPDVRLIVCLRDPVKRAFSQFLHDRSIGLTDDMTFEQALKENDSYFEKGLYYKYLKDYFDIFGQEKIFVTFIQDIKRDNLEVAQRLYEFLGLNDTDFVPQHLNSKPNTASKAVLPFVNSFLLNTEYFLRKHKMDFVLNLLENTGIRKAAFLFSYYINRKPLEDYPELSKKTEKEMRKKYRQDINKLEKLLEQDLSRWK